MKQFTSKLHSAASRLTPTPHSHNKNTFELISLKSQSASPSSDKQTLLPDVSGKQAKKTTSVSDTRLTKKEIPEASTAVRATVSDQLLASTKLPKSAAHLPNSKPAADHQKVPSHTNRTLRYMVHHFPQVSSRQSSVMVKHFLYLIFLILFLINLLYFIISHIISYYFILFLYF